MRSISRCGTCGAFVQGDDRFCWSCGSDLRYAPPRPSARAGATPAESSLDHEMHVALRRAYLAQQRGQLDEAERMVREVLEERPHAIPALSMLVSILRAKGDLVGSVGIAQRVSELAAEGEASPRAIARARQDRAEIEEQVVRDAAGSLGHYDTPFHMLLGPDRLPTRLRHWYLALTTAGAVCLVLALAAVLKSYLSGYVWFAVSLLAAGWCYHDAEARGQAAIFWAPFVLCTGPFGLAVYLLAAH